MDIRIARELVEAWKANERVPPFLLPSCYEVSVERGISIIKVIEEELGIVEFLQRKRFSFLAKTFIGNRFSMASDLLWDGRFDEAAAMLVTLSPSTQGKKIHSARFRHFTESKRTRWIKLRELSKGHDWKTVK